MSMVPWAEGQVMVSPPTTVEPVQVKVRPNRSGRFSMAAVRVTVLNTEPGVKVLDRKRFTYTPSYRSSPS